MRFGLLLVPTLVAGCSLIYNPDGIPTKQDAPINPPADADPTMLTLLDIAPATILEGQGDGGSAPALVVIHGHQIVQGATVQISGALNVSADNSSVSVAINGDYLAVLVTATVDAKPEGPAVPLTVTVTQPTPTGMVTQTLPSEQQLMFQPLTTLDNTFNGDASLLQGHMFASVEITTDLHLTGTTDQPATIRAVASISVGNVFGVGADSPGQTPGTGGPGACDGGGSGANAPCGSAGGTAGGTNGTTTGGGGGGGGFGSMGLTATGSNPGTGGATSGKVDVASYSANHGFGGGGGGAPVLSSTGAGGGGGGVVELTAGGDVTIGSIDTHGGVGGAAKTGLSGGGGGGGSGGAIVVRAGHNLTFTGTGSVLKATGGAGGAKSGFGDNGAAGGDGRLRWDAPMGTPPTTSPAVSHRGPSFLPLANRYVTDDSPMVALTGTKDDMVGIVITDGGGVSHATAPQVFDASNSVVVKTPLTPGYNQICATLSDGDQGAGPGQTCIDLAYLPTSAP